MYLTFHKEHGRLEFYGVMDFRQVLSLNAAYIFTRDRDERGRFCKPFATDGSGNVVCEDLAGLTGRLDFDGEHDTYYTIEANDPNDLGDNEARALLDASGYTGVPDDFTNDLREWRA